MNLSNAAHERSVKGNSTRLHSSRLTVADLYAGIPIGITASHDEMTAIRRDFHANPELRYEEHRTAKLIAEKLRGWGLAVETGVGGTGVVATLDFGTPHCDHRAALMLRAEMDALPLLERNEFAHRSRTAGVMHACGHDGHMTMLLATAKQLAAQRPERPQLQGRVHFVFQPAEEGGAGAKAMIDDGLFQRFDCERVYALHNLPSLAPGEFAAIEGAAQASSNEFDITLTGRGGHGAMPHECVDLVVTGAQIACALQTVASRSVSPQAPVVLSIGQFNAGTAVNVLPDVATLRGTVRTFDEGTTDLVESRMRSIINAVSESMGAAAKFTLTRKYPPLINDVAAVRFAYECVNNVGGATRAVPMPEKLMAADDFAFMLRERPGAMVYIGNGSGERRPLSDQATASSLASPCLLHSANYDFNDAIIPLGAAFWSALVLQSMTHGGTT
jgi:amidohydrolase